MRYSAKTIRPPRAWLIRGADPTVWLEEITTWNVPHSAIRLYCLPYGMDNLRPRDVLAVLPDSCKPAASQLCIPYGRIADRLYLPSNGRFDPDVSSTDLQNLLSEKYLYVWHPPSGLIAFEPNDVIRVSDLLQPGPLIANTWNLAMPGTAFSRRLLSLAPDKNLTLEDLMQKGRDDIGTDSASLTDLPPSPAEPKTDLFHKSAQYGQDALARMIRWLVNQAPATAGQPTWLDHLGQWANQKLAGISSAMEAARNKEIARLMHLLETDPDRGLRFALPLTGDAHRGLAPPSNRLGERNIDFSFGRLGGGLAGDFWDISQNYRLRLTSRYRELANRELNLGRHRRAAYIFAELLGDYDGAANALISGRHWREAAALYQKRLNQPLDATQCLEQGGLWTEAISLYRELELYEKAGDLFEKLQQRSDACQMYREAVAACRNKGDTLQAARILDKKLQAPDEAIAELEASWPDSPQAGQCLRVLFALFGRLGRHEYTRKWIDRFHTTQVPVHCRASLVEFLADTANDYPDRITKLEAADGTRILVSRALQEESWTDNGRLLAAVSRLVPEDSLLRRDCQRYRHKPPAIKMPVAVKTSSRKKAPKLLQTIGLPKQVEWRSATSGGKTIFAAGFLDDRLVLTRCSWDGFVDPILKPWKVERSLTTAPILLVTNPWNDNRLFVHVVGGPVLPATQSFRQTDRFPTEILTGEIPGVWSAVVGATRSVYGTTWLVDAGGDYATLVALGHGGEQISNETVPFPEPSEEAIDQPLTIPIPIHARHEKVYVGLGNHLLTFDKNKERESIEFEQPILSLQGSSPHTRARLALTFPRGGAICWDEFGGIHSEFFATDMPNPVACFNRGGYLIAASEHGCDVYRTKNRRL
ncbi:MAG: hypothetical protein PVH19_15310, partial [Planctomycetia bacterium]